MNQQKAVCLFSGGLDSTTVLYYALREGYEVTALTLLYGQTHAREVESARNILKSLDVKQYVLEIALPWGGSALTDDKIEIPKRRAERIMSDEIPSTYVPARNTIFLSMAASLAETIGANAIFIGANAIDYSGYPDCRMEYMGQFEKALNLGTKAGVQGQKQNILVPLIDKTKKDIILMGNELGVPFEMTWSCYVGGKKPCGICDSCVLRKKGFEEAGLKDPAVDYEISAN